jgi:hypothetical protein
LHQFKQAALSEAPGERQRPTQAHTRQAYAGHFSFPRIKQMSIISKFVTLGLAAVLSSPIPHHQIDYNTSGLDSQRINQLWLVTYINEAGEEVVVQAKLVNGSFTPLIAADPVRLESMMPAARDIAKTRNIKMRLIKLTSRVDVEDIVP